MLREILAALDLKVEIDGQTFTPRLKPGDMVRFEQHFGRSLIGDGNSEVTFGVTELFYLAFLACKREGRFDGDFDAFCDTVDDVDMDGGTPDPKAGLST